MQQSNNKIGHYINVSKMPLNRAEEIEYTKEDDWVRELLLELNENAKEQSPEYYLEQTILNINVKITKKYTPEMGEYLLLTGRLYAEYYTSCVRTLREMTGHMDVQIKAAIIDKSFADTPEFEELTEIFIDQDIYELYYYEKRKADLKELIHEQLFLHLEPYPVIDDNAPLEKNTSKGPIQ